MKGMESRGEERISMGRRRRRVAKTAHPGAGGSPSPRISRRASSLVSGRALVQSEINHQIGGEPFERLADRIPGEPDRRSKLGAGTEQA